MRMQMQIMHMPMHMHMSMHMHKHMHSAMILLQELETHRHLQSIKGRKRKERDMSTSRKRVYRREGKILIRIGLVQGKNMVGEGSQRGGMDMDIIPVPTNVMKLIVEIAEKEMNTTVTVIRETEKEIEIPLGQLIVMTEARKIPMVGKGEEVEV
jgi:class 3 adenylate cyclase